MNWVDGLKIRFDENPVFRQEKNHLAKLIESLLEDHLTKQLPAPNKIKTPKLEGST